MVSVPGRGGVGGLPGGGELVDLSPALPPRFNGAFALLAGLFWLLAEGLCLRYWVAAERFTGAV